MIRYIAIILILLSSIVAENHYKYFGPCVWEEYNVYSDLNPYDVIILSKLVNSESAGESMQDKLAVASVVVNRVNHENYPDIFREVIYEKRQFSGVNGSNFKYNRRNERERESIYAAMHVLKFGPIDSSILFFHNPEIATDISWIERFNGTDPVIINENHVFFSKM